MEFKAYRKTVRSPVYLIVDIETVNAKKQYRVWWPLNTYPISHLYPAGWSIEICSDYDGYDLPVESYSGPDAARLLVEPYTSSSSHCWLLYKSIVMNHQLL